MVIGRKVEVKTANSNRRFLDPDGLNGARIGVMRNGVTGGSAKTDAIYDTVIQAMSDAGATIVDPADIPTITDIIAFGSEFVVLTYDFLRDLNAYLATRVGVPIRQLQVLLRVYGQYGQDQWFWVEVRNSSCTSSIGRRRHWRYLGWTRR